MGSGKGSSNSYSTKAALYCLLLLVALVLGLAAGFIIGFLVKDFDDDDSSTETDVHEGPVTVFNHAPGKCQEVKGIDIGSEDMVVLPSGLAIITAGMNAFMPRDRPDLLNRKGSLKLFDFNDPESGAADIPIVNEDAFDYPHFNPHGMSAWMDEEADRVFVFVVNHNYVPDMIETMERFEFDEENRELTWLESISDDDNMILMNNVVATGQNTFYYTNFLSSRDPAEVARQLDERTPTGGVGYYDGEKATMLFDGLRSPNGINVSPDGKYVYLAEFGEDTFHTYQRDVDNNQLTLYKSYKMNTGVDNLDIDAEGYVWVGCHPDHPQILRYLTDPNVIPTPSQTLRLKVEDGELTETLEVYMDDGNIFSAVTVAVHYEDKLLMGSLYTKALLCDIEYLG